MATLTEKLKLVDQFDYTLEMDKTSFIQSLGKIVDNGSSSDLFSKYADRFVTGENDYIGIISENNFEVRKRSGFLNNSGSLAIGKFTAANGSLSITAKITALNGGNILSLLVIILFFLAGLIFTYVQPERATFTIFLKFFSPLFVFILLFVFFSMRRSVSGLRDEIESEFDLLKRKNKNTR